MKNKDYKMQVLRENYSEYIRSCEDDMSFREYVEREAENDPGFFRFLFDDSELGDSDSWLNDEQRKEFNEFINEL